jgi:hypothetical protein
MIKVNITYSIITPESAETGDFAELGFESEGEEMSFEEIIEWMEGGEPSSSPLKYVNEYTWVTKCERDFYTGNETCYSIHFADKPAKAKYWVKAIHTALGRK